MSRQVNAGVIVGVLVVGVLVIVALRSTSTETVVLAPVTVDPQDVEPGTGVVIGKHESGGFSILGLQFGHKTYRMSVQFFDEPGCYEVVSFGEPWPTPFQECSNSVAITGEISGIGNTATGESIIGVDIEVPEDCYQAVARGDAWPPTEPACTRAGD